MAIPTLSILIIDSDPRSIHEVLGLLEASPLARFSVGEAPTVCRAIEMLESKPFDAIVFGALEGAAESLQGMLSLRRKAPQLPLVSLLGPEASIALTDSLRGLSDDAVLRQKLDSPRLCSALMMAVERRSMEGKSAGQRTDSDPKMNDYKLLLNELDHAVFLVTTKAGRLLLKNDKAQDWFGDSIPSVLRELYDYGVLLGEEVEVEIALIESAVSNFELRSKSISWNGESCCMISLRNISKRKRAESAYRSAQRRLELALRSSDVGFWSWDLRQHKLRFSDRWKSQIGHASDSFPDTLSAYRTAIHPEDRQKAVEAFRGLLKGDRGDFEHEFRLQHADGSYRHILCRAEVFPDEQGKLALVLGTHVDITGRAQSIDKPRPEAAEPSVDMVASLHDRIGRLAVRISDESHFLKGHFRGDSRMAHELGSMEDDARRILALKECVVSDAGATCQNDEVDIGNLVTSLLEPLARLLPSNARLSLVESSESAIARLDASVARLALAEAMSVVGEQVQTDFQNEVELAVCCSGGVSLEILYEGSLARPYDLRSLNEQDGIEVSCVERNGRCVMAMNFAAKSVAEVAKLGAVPCVLLAEDEGVLRLAIQSMLESIDCRVVLAENGVEAIKRFKEHRSELTLALIDLHMPGMDGRGVLESIRAQSSEIPIIKMSGDDEGAAGELFGQKDPFSCFLAKPFGIDELKKTISRFHARAGTAC